jgi:hypothetical protein
MPRSPKARFCATMPSDWFRFVRATNTVYGTTGTDAMNRNIWVASSPAAVISRSVDSGNTERDCGSPGGSAQRRKRLSDGYPRIIRPERSIPIVLYTIRTVALSVSRNIRMEAMIAFGHFEAPKRRQCMAGNGCYIAAVAGLARGTVWKSSWFGTCSACSAKAVTLAIVPTDV